MKAQRDINGLIRALKHKSDDTARDKEVAGRIRHGAAKALGEFGEPRAVEPLIALLINDYNNVRAAVAEALGRIGDPRAIEPLIEELNSIDDEVRRSAGKALASIGAPAVMPLITALRECWSSNGRVAAAQVLGKIGDGRVTESLILALRDTDATVREEAAKVLEKLGWRTEQDETAAWYWSAKNEWDKCIGLGHLAVEPLIAALSHRDLKVRVVAAQTLVELYKEISTPKGTKARILSVRWKIANLGHEDETGLSEYNPLGGCVTKDDFQHTDRNIGMDFPL
jgi:HEAT repeat protein